jgi:beta-galactosidase GanA
MKKKQLDKAAAEARKEYFREWRKKNSDKVKNYNENYWRKRAERSFKDETNDNATSTE